MATTTTNNLKHIYAHLPPGMPVTSEDLMGFGVSGDLAVHYARAGWLNRLARGVYCRPGESLALYPCLELLQRKVPGLHVGGKTALEWYGIRHYVPQTSILHLYGWAAAQLPEWFTVRFPSEYHRKRLFTETPDALLETGKFENQNGAPFTSTPERALLELLSEIGVRQPLAEAREITEGTYTLRADTLHRLLLQCNSIKTVRLCLQLGHELNLDWINKLDTKNLPTGSDKAWVSKSKHGLLILKP